MSPKGKLLHHAQRTIERLQKPQDDYKSARAPEKIREPIPSNTPNEAAAGRCTDFRFVHQISLQPATYAFEFGHKV